MRHPPQPSRAGAGVQGGKSQAGNAAETGGTETQKESHTWRFHQKDVPVAIGMRLECFRVSLRPIFEEHQNCEDSAHSAGNCGK